MLSPILPPGVNFIFTIMEPVSLIAGFIGSTPMPSKFLTDSLPTPPILPHSAPALLVTQQLGSCFLLLGLVGLVVLRLSHEPAVVRAYLGALAVGDVVHIGITAAALGKETLFRPGSWNALVSMSLGFTSGVLSGSIWGGWEDREDISEEIVQEEGDLIFVSEIAVRRGDTRVKFEWPSAKHVSFHQSKISEVTVPLRKKWTRATYRLTLSQVPLKDQSESATILMPPFVNMDF
ncbi:MAG: hypothetical protein M1814_006079 [Vezdaea aestivalis]|nr:MAG: hypothetical protein M1814_006079 [Vezdaea aestivalis]